MKIKGFIICLIGIVLISSNVLAKKMSETDVLRKEAENLVIEQSLRYWGNRVFGKDLNITETYKGHEHLFTRETIKKVEDAMKKAKRGDGKRALRYFKAYLSVEYIGLEIAPIEDELAKYEANATVKLPWINEPVTYRDLDILSSQEKDKEKRQKILESRASVWRELNKYHEKIEEKGQFLAKQLGYSSYVELSEELKSMDLKYLIEVSDKFFKETDAIYQKLLREEVENAGMKFEEFRRADIGRLHLAPQFEKFFPAELIIPSFKLFIKGMGLDMKTIQGTEIFVHDQALPKKNPRAACFSIVVPEDIRITVKPSGGIPDFETFFHEGGHALHFANTRERIWEFKELGNNTATEAYAGLFGGIFADPNWLKKYREFVIEYNEKNNVNIPVMTDEDIGSLIRNRIFWNIYFNRRYGRTKLIYETILHGGDEEVYEGIYRPKTEDLQKIYRDLFSKSYGIILDETDSLRFRTDVDSFFYAADYCRASALASQIEETLRRKFGEKWFENKKAGKFLKNKLWAYGNKLTGEEVSSLLLGYEELDFQVLARRIKRLFEKSQKLKRE